MFAKTLKDTAWGRQTTSTPLKTTHLPTHKTQIQTPSRNAQSHHRERPPLAAQYWGPSHHAKFPIRTPHAPALHHHRTPQSAPDDHLRHPRPPQKHHSRHRTNTRMGPSPAKTSLPPVHAPSADNTLISAPLPHSRSYAQALKGQANTLEMSEIRQLLNYISTQLTAWGSTQHTNICLTTRKTKQQQHYFLNIFDYIRKGLPLFLKIRTLYIELLKWLSISMWNIQGLNSTAFGLKSLNTEFQNSIKEMDIVILQETWSRADTITHCPPNYREIILPSQKLSTVRQGRDSGGQIIWYKSKFHNHINTVKQGKYYTWLKIHKELLSSRKYIFLCAIYSTSRHQSPPTTAKTCSPPRETCSSAGTWTQEQDYSRTSPTHKVANTSTTNWLLLTTLSPISTEITMTIQ